MVLLSVLFSAIDWPKRGKTWKQLNNNIQNSSTGREAHYRSRSEAQIPQKVIHWNILVINPAEGVKSIGTAVLLWTLGIDQLHSVQEKERL